MLAFGASYGLSAVATVDLGAQSVVGVEPEAWRVEQGTRMLEQSGYADRVSLLTVEDTRHLPLPEAGFSFILVNAVFEHIPQPRAAYVRELWRVLASGGTILVNETPNKYLPWDFHTTNLVGVNWLPSRLARWYSIQRGRYSEDRDWTHSGRRGMGYYRAGPRHSGIVRGDARELPAPASVVPATRAPSWPRRSVPDTLAPQANRVTPRRMGHHRLASPTRRHGASRADVVRVDRRRRLSHHAFGNR